MVPSTKNRINMANVKLVTVCKMNGTAVFFTGTTISILFFNNWQNPDSLFMLKC
jgi:hypothetical protein